MSAQWQRLAVPGALIALMDPDDRAERLRHGRHHPHLPLCVLALGLNVVVGFAACSTWATSHFSASAPICTRSWPRRTSASLAVPAGAADRHSCDTALFGVLIGAPTLRLRGDYLAIVTLGFGEIIYLLLINLDRPIDITGGPSGIIAIDPPSFVRLRAPRQHPVLLPVPGAPGVAVLFSRRLRDSRVGWAWQAIREDELAAQAMGINMTVAKLQAFAIGASFAGVGGAFWPPGSARCSPTISCSPNR